MAAVVAEAALEPAEVSSLNIASNTEPLHHALRNSTLLLVGANLLPLLGVLLLGWDVFSILMVFWVENVVIGLFGVLRTARATGSVFLPLFFLVHYGGFMAGHAMVLLLFAGNQGANGAIDPQQLLDFLKSPYIVLVAAALTVSHGYSYVKNFLGAAEYRNLSRGQAMALPYSRMMITHVALLLGGALLEFMGQPILGLVVLVLLKIGMDLRFHWREHEKLGAVRAQ